MYVFIKIKIKLLKLNYGIYLFKNSKKVIFIKVRIIVIFRGRGKWGVFGSGNVIFFDLGIGYVGIIVINYFGFV